MSWNILSEAMGHHSTGLLVGGKAKDRIEDLGIHHNFFMSNSHRNPWVKNKDARVINNLVYNWRFFGLAFSDGQTIDIIGNRYRPGPTTTGRPAILYSRSTSSFDVQGVDGDPSIYISGNKSDEHPDPTADNWEMIEDAEGWSPTGNAPPRDTRRDSPMQGAAFPIQPESVDRMETRVLDHAGASRRLDADGNWVPNRDAVDQRLIREYNAGEGQIPDNEQEVGGMPDISGGTPYRDADGDGMADAWEASHGFDNEDASDGRADADGDGYTNVEEFLNGTDPRAQTDPGDSPFGAEPATTEFSDIPMFGDRDNYKEKTPARWRVLSDRGDLRYGLITTTYQGDDGRLGEYTIVPDKSFGDVEVSARVRSTENFSANGGADYVLILGYIDADNYYYAMFNRSPGSSGLYRFEDGERTELAVVDDRVIADNDYHEVTFSRQGETLTMTMDGRELATARDSRLGDGAIGVGAFNDGAYFDDIAAITDADDSDDDPKGDTGTADAGGDSGTGHRDAGPDDTNTRIDASVGSDTEPGDRDTSESPERIVENRTCSQGDSGPTPIEWILVVVFGGGWWVRRRL